MPKEPHVWMSAKPPQQLNKLDQRRRQQTPTNLTGEPRMVDAGPVRLCRSRSSATGLRPPFGRWAGVPPLRCALSLTGHDEHHASRAIDVIGAGFGSGPESTTHEPRRTESACDSHRVCARSKCSVSVPRRTRHRGRFAMHDQARSLKQGAHRGFEVWSCCSAKGVPLCAQYHRERQLCCLDSLNVLSDPSSAVSRLRPL